MDKQRFAVFSSHRECRIMCNIRKNGFPPILTGSILQDTLAGQEIAGFMKFQVPLLRLQKLSIGKSPST
jgi:hypothetical protein